MARINQPLKRLKQRRGAAATSKSSLCTINCLLIVLGSIVILLLWLDHRIIVESNNNTTNNDVIASLNNHTAGGGSVSSITSHTIDHTDNKPIQIAYAISLIRCSDFQSSTSGLLDAATILRHSIHKTSIRNPTSGSKYDYALYAIVHKKASECSHILSDLGYTVLIKDSPVQISEIKGDYLRKNVHKEWCCGADEFVKLYAYTIENHPIVVHTDIDFMYFQPMDDVYDAMLLPANTHEGKMARSKIEMEYPDKVVPTNIQAYLTRDYHQVIPGRKAGE